VRYAPNKINSFYGSAKFYTTARLKKNGVTDQTQIERDSSNAGRRMLVSVLERLANTHIDAYAEINLFGFYLLSKAIGGVPVCLNAAVSDPFSGANFAAGPQEVEGTAALAFVRQRHGLPGGDLDRIRRQQAFLSGAISKVLSVGTLTNPSKLSALIDAMNRSIVLSSGFSLLQLAEQMANVTSGNINFVTLPTHGSEPSTNTDALAIDVMEVRTLFAGLDAPASSAAAPTIDPASITVDVQNGTTTPGLARDTSDSLVKLGFPAGEVSTLPGVTAKNQQSTTTIHYRAGDEAAAQAVQQGLGFGTLQADKAVTAKHVLVVIGTDRVGSAATGAATAGTPVPATTTENAGPAATTSAAPTINAAQPGCVN
jgi:LCP family protein required for cell wall assembly